MDDEKVKKQKVEDEVEKRKKKRFLPEKEKFTEKIKA